MTDASDDFRQEIPLQQACDTLLTRRFFRQWMR